MKMLDILLVIYMMNVVFVFYTYYAGLDRMFPETTQKAKDISETLMVAVNNNLPTDASIYSVVIDIIGRVSLGLIGIFKLIVLYPSLVATFVKEAMAIINLPFNDVIATLLTAVGVGLNIYYIKVILEWIKGGFTSNT